MSFLKRKYKTESRRIRQRSLHKQYHPFIIWMNFRSAKKLHSARLSRWSRERGGQHSQRNHRTLNYWPACPAPILDPQIEEHKYQPRWAICQGHTDENNRFICPPEYQQFQCIWKLPELNVQFNHFERSPNIFVPGGV